MFAVGGSCRMPVKTRHKNPNALKKIADRYKKGFSILVGYPSSKTKSIEYPDGTSVIEVAAANNFGVPSQGIPRRPFMTLAKEPTIKRIKPIVKVLIHKLNKGEITMERIIDQIAPVAVSVFKETIVKLKTPPNAPSTIRKKKSDNPLIDTGLLVGTLTFDKQKAKK